MQTAGIIIEYNPMHRGHQYLIEQTRARLGADTAVIGVMSGNFVQRGDFALLRKQARAEAAVRSGMDLVLELPLSWATASAERFADGGVQVLRATGLVTHLAFGSECGSAGALNRVAAALLREELPPLLRQELLRGDSFASARQRAVEALLSPEDAVLLESPNNTLGIEYCKALLRHGSGICPMTVERAGMPHDGTGPRTGPASAGLIRAALKSGDRDRALAEMTPAMADLYRTEEAAGRAPVFRENSERAVLARLRSMTEGEFAALDEGQEGLYHRLYHASRTACSLEEVLLAAKTRRYPYARLARMALWAYLGLTPETLPVEIPYVRPLAANRTGRALLAAMRRSAAVPVLTKPADVRALSPVAQTLFCQEVRATDLYTLAYPALVAARGGTEWREGPVIL